nr:hypothetical protein [Amycolatopsis sulphurea]
MAERDVRVVLAIEVHLIRGLVPVGGGELADHGLARAGQRAADLDVLLDDPAKGNHAQRGDPGQFLHRLGHQPRFGAQPLPQPRPVQQGEHVTAELVGGGLAARCQQGGAQLHQFLVGAPVLGLLRRDDEADQIVTRRHPPPGRQVGEEVLRIAAGGDDLLDRHIGDRAGLVRPFVELRALVPGRAEEFADSGDRRRPREIRDQIRGRSLCRHSAGQLVHHMLDPGAHQLDPAHRESSRDHPAHPGVLRRVEIEQIRCALDQRHRARHVIVPRRGPAEPLIGQDELDVGQAGRQPCRTAIGHLEPAESLPSAEPPVLRCRLQLPCLRERIRTGLDRHGGHLPWHGLDGEKIFTSSSTTCRERPANLINSKGMPSGPVQAGVMAWFPAGATPAPPRPPWPGRHPRRSGHLGRGDSRSAARRHLLSFEDSHLAGRYGPRMSAKSV